MALTFNGTSSKLVGSPLVDDFPFALFAWIKPANLAADQMVFGVGDLGGSTEAEAFFKGTTAGDPVLHYNIGTNGVGAWATSSDGADADAWKPCLIVCNSITERLIYFGDSPAASSNATSVSVNPALFDRLVVGTRPRADSLWFAGDVGHLAVWQGTVPDATDWASLQSGTQPDLIQSSSLLDYWSLEAQASTQVGINGNALTATNTSQAATDPPTEVPPPPQNVIVVDGLWTWFTEPRAVYYNGATYVGWVDSGGGSGISRIDAASLVKTHAVLGTGEVDDHNNIAIHILPDGKIMGLWTGHGTTEGVKQRISAAADSVASFGAQSIIDSTALATTYCNPHFLSAAGTSGRLYNHYRVGQAGSENWAGLIHSDDNGATWSSETQIFAYVPGKVPYVKSVSNGVDRIDFYVTDDHPDLSASSLYHCYAQWVSGALSFFDSAGTPLTLPITISTDCTQIYDGASTRAWNWDMVFGGDGHPRVVFQRTVSLSPADHRYMFARWTGSAWTTAVEIAAGGGYLYSGEPHYAGGIAFDRIDPNIVYLSRDTVSTGTFEIEQWSTDDNGATWSKDADITSGSPAGTKNARPYSPIDADSNARLLYWRGTYTSFTNYDTALIFWPAAAPAAQFAGDAAATATATGALTTQIPIAGAAVAQAAAVAGIGAVSGVVTGTGVLAAQAATVVGTAERELTATGALSSQTAAVAGTAEREITGTGAPASTAATMAGTGTVTSPGVHTGTGALAAQAATMTGAGILARDGTGVLAAGVATINATGIIARDATGALTAQAAAIAGTGTVSVPGVVTGTGVLAGLSAAVSGTGTVQTPDGWTPVPSASGTWSDIAASTSTWTEI